MKHQPDGALRQGSARERTGRDAARASGDGSWRAWIRREAQHGTTLFRYLFTLLSLFVMNKIVTTRNLGDRFALKGIDPVNAGILTKVMMLSRHIRVSCRMSHLPRVIAESALCRVLFLLVHTADRPIFGVFRGQEVPTSRPSFGGGGPLG